MNRTATCSATLCGTISATGLKKKKKEMKVLTESRCCFCLISVARKVTSQQELDVLESRTGHGRWRQVTRCVGHKIALLSRVRGDVQSTTNLALRRVPGGTKHRIRTAQSARKTQTQIRTAQSARILELQIDKLEFLAEFTKRARCEITRRTTRTDEVRMDARRRSTFLDGQIKRTALESVLRKPREHLTALLDLCTHDKKHQM